MLGKTVVVEGLRKNGQVFPAELSVSTWTDTAGRVFCGILRDVTERERAQEELRKTEIALRESEARLKAFLGYANVIVAIKDTHQRFILVNKAFTEERGSEASELLGKSARDVHPVEVAEESERTDPHRLSQNRLQPAQ